MNADSHTALFRSIRLLIVALFEWNRWMSFTATQRSSLATTCH